MADFDLHTNFDDGLSVLTVAGEIDLSCASTLRALGQLALDGDASTVNIDMHGVTFLDSTGIGALVQIRNTAQERRKAVTLCRPSAPVVKMMALTGLTSVFGVACERPYPRAP